MTYGAAIFLIAVGAILKWAVTATVGGIDIATIGVILMIAGLIGLAIGLFQSMQGRTVSRRTIVADPVVGERVSETREVVR